MTSLTECQICFENFYLKNIGKVACGSSVDHYLCFDCEFTWRSKMPLKDGVRIMNCPTCRQPEQYRTIESLQRQVRMYQPTIVSLQRLQLQLNQSEGSNVRLDYAQSGTREAPVVLDARPAVMRPPRAPRSRCASGRDCESISQSGRSMTHLKCIYCQTVFCCRNCMMCVGCTPLYPFEIEQLRFRFASS